VDSWSRQSGLETSSLLDQGRDDLENETARRRHVTGEGHNGDNITPMAGVTLAGKSLELFLLVLQFVSSLLLLRECNATLVKDAFTVANIIPNSPSTKLCKC